jgi:ABC-type sugar transport system substrate-binding protein
LKPQTGIYAIVDGEKTHLLWMRDLFYNWRNFMKQLSVSAKKVFFPAVLVLALVFSACQKKDSPGDAALSSIPNAGVFPDGGHYKAESKSDKLIRIAFLGWANNPFHDEIQKGVEAAKTYLAAYNCSVEYVVMGEDITLPYAIAAIENAIAKQYDGFVCIPAFDGTEVPINRAVDAGQVVVTTVAESTKPSKRLAFYGQNGYDAGILAGQIIAQYMGGSGKLGVITGVLGVTQHEMRKNGATDYIAQNNPGINVIGVWENNDKAETAYSLTNDMLTANPDLKCIYVTAGGPFGAAKAIQDAGLTGKVGVVGFDWLPDSLKYVATGEQIALISQDPFGMGFDTCVMVYNNVVFKTKPADTDVIYNEPLVVTPDTLAELVPDFKP